MQSRNFSITTQLKASQKLISTHRPNSFPMRLFLSPKSIAEDRLINLMRETGKDKDSKALFSAGTHYEF